MSKKLIVSLALLLSMGVYAEEVMNVYAIGLVGGIGERLWPISRVCCPKQFLPLGSSLSLLEQSLVRFEGIIAPECLWAVTSETQAGKLKSMAPNLGGLIIEPAMRNTGPAILLSCLELYERDPDAILIFFPADPYIPESDYGLFRSYVKNALDHIRQHPQNILLFGVRPTFPATGYGYIEYDETGNVNHVFPVTRFHEKPSFKLAKNYVNQQNMLWNIGMFGATVQTFINEFKTVAPDLFAEVVAFKGGEKSYESITSISIDCAVMERSNHVSVLPVDFSWCDVGNVETFLSIKNQSSTSTLPIISVDSKNNLVDVPSKLVALVGVQDLCVVETADALLITKRSDAEKVRGVVQQLKQEQLNDYL